MTGLKIIRGQMNAHMYRPLAPPLCPEANRMNEQSFDGPSWARGAQFVSEQKNHADRLYLLDLVRVLRPHAAGLRRWSVMHKIRAYRDAAGSPVGDRMEDAIERLFRNHCADA